LLGHPHNASLLRAEKKACRSLISAGCEPETLRRIVAHLSEAIPLPAERVGRLLELATFVKAIGHRAARDYFRAVEETRAVALLTDPAVLDFARSVDPHTAEWYFWAMWGTKAVRELTDPDFLAAGGFFRAMDGSAIVEYFLAIRETKAAAKLTDPRVLAFARSIGSDAAVEYFGSLWEMGDVTGLTSATVLSLATWMDGNTAKEYFAAIRETRAFPQLAGEGVLGLARLLGGRVAEEYFRAIRTTRCAAELTSDSVTVFAEVIGRDCASEYFRVITGTRKVAELTSERLLRASSVIRRIGSDAALDYFLAVAATNVVQTPTGPTGEREPSPEESGVPVLTLLDIPKYERYRPVALVGASALFWGCVWQAGAVTLSTTQGYVYLLGALCAWVAVLWGTHLFSGVVAERSAEQFVRERRRLLNESGIRWHDCLAGDRKCPLCWGASPTHRDERFDYGRFCRCPAC